MTTQERVELVRDQGFCIVPDVIPESEIQGVCASVLKTANEQGEASYFAPSSTVCIAGLINYNQSFASYLVESRLTELVVSLLDEHYRVSFTTALVNHPSQERGQWHADWPFLQHCGARIVQPYPDAIMHLTCLFMLSDFTPETGATLVLPKSHRRPFNPTGESGVEKFEATSGEKYATGSAGSVLVMDSRCWHAAAPNRSKNPRVAFAVRFAPWWLNLEVLREDSFLHRRMVAAHDKPDGSVPSLPWTVYEKLPHSVKPLFHHWIEREMLVPGNSEDAC